MRSLLFVPGDSPRKLDKALQSGADCLLLDLEDSVALDAKAKARTTTSHFLARQRRLSATDGLTAGMPQTPGLRDAAGAAPPPALWVRINPLQSGLAEADLKAIVAAQPEGILLPKARGGQDVRALAMLLDQEEEKAGLAPGAIDIIALVTEVPASLLDLASYAGASSRLTALTWGAEDLSAELGAMTNRTPDGRYTPPYELARSLTLYAAAASEVPAIDTVWTAFRDMEGLERECREALRDGFGAKMAIHPAQVDVINRIFTPSIEEIGRAEQIVALFDANPGLGVIGLDGEMLDRPHYLRAQRTLARAKAAATHT